MASRRWKTWPGRFGDAIQKTGGAVGLVGVAMAAVGVTVAPVLIPIGVVTIGCSLLYAAVRGIPPKLLSAPNLVGKQISLTELSQIEPPVMRLGILGATQSGKSTFLKHVQQEIPLGQRTNKLYAVIVALQTAPPTYVALLDGDGKQFAQQFEIASTADFILIFVDHDPGNDKTTLSHERLDEHDRFLEQLQFHLDSRERVPRLHLVLNKRDLWEGSSSAWELRDWFQEHTKHWERARLSQEITAESHSNNNSSDITKILNHIADQARNI